MSVKGIFKALIGTILLIVTSFMAIELINVTISALELTQISKIAARQAAVLFSQETYKGRGGAGTVAWPDVVGYDGGKYISGKFYGNYTGAEEIYKSIYTSSKFTNWLDDSPSNHSVKMNDYWRNVRLINRALNGSLNLTMPTNLEDTSGLQDYTDSLIAKSYVDVMMTPLNMGVPYLDIDIVQNIFRWNLAQMTSDCNSSLIRKDPYSTEASLRNEYFVYYNGFRVFAQNAEITELDYQVYKLKDASDNTKFQEITHIDPNQLGFEYNMDYLGIDDDERQNICIVGINYKIPMSYEGITPLRRLAEFVWNYDVKGFAKNGDPDDPGFTEGTHSWSDATSDLVSGGFEGNNNKAAGILPVPGKLIYYVVR